MNTNGNKIPPTPMKSRLSSPFVVSRNGRHPNRNMFNSGPKKSPLRNLFSKIPMRNPTSNSSNPLFSPHKVRKKKRRKKPPEEDESSDIDMDEIKGTFNENFNQDANVTPISPTLDDDGQVDLFSSLMGSHDDGKSMDDEDFIMTPDDDSPNDFDGDDDGVLSINPLMNSTRSFFQRNSLKELLNSKGKKRDSIQVWNGDEYVLVKREAGEDYYSRFMEDFVVEEVFRVDRYSKWRKCKHNLDALSYMVVEMKDQIKNDNVRMRVLRELNRMASARESPFLTSYFSGWVENNILFVQSQYSEYPSLEDNVFNRGPWRETEVLKFIKQVATGLEIIHETGRAHLNICPANICCNTRGMSYRITTMGFLLPFLNINDFKNEPCIYYAKELVYGNKIGKMDFRKCDIFSLGCVVLEMISGKKLPGKVNLIKQWLMIREGKLPFLNKVISNDFKKLLSFMLHPSPSLRPTAKQLKEHKYLNMFLPSLQSTYSRNIFLETDVLNLAQISINLNGEIRRLKKVRDEKSDEYDILSSSI